MFQFSGFASWTSSEWYAFSIPGCPIRIFADHKLFASPHNFSQLITSFFASESLGIRHTPFSTFFYFLFLKLIYFQHVKELLIMNTKCVMTYVENTGVEPIFLFLSNQSCPRFSFFKVILNNNSYKKNLPLTQSKLWPPERRCSSHTFRYGYLVTT